MLKPEGLAGLLYDKASFVFPGQPGTLCGLQLVPERGDKTFPQLATTNTLQFV